MTTRSNPFLMYATYDATSPSSSPSQVHAGAASRWSRSRSKRSNVGHSLKSIRVKSCIAQLYHESPSASMRWYCAGRQTNVSMTGHDVRHASGSSMSSCGCVFPSSASNYNRNHEIKAVRTEKAEQMKRTYVVLELFGELEMFQVGQGDTMHDLRRPEMRYL